MSKTPNYSALKALSKKLQHQVYSLNQQISLLKQECSIQGKIIEQLKALHSSSLLLKTNSLCEAGHRDCEIEHFSTKQGYECSVFFRECTFFDIIWA